MKISDRESATALIERWRTDPFGVLGPHCVGKKRWEIRVYAPAADALVALAIRDKAALCVLHRAHNSGFWIGELTGDKRPDYLLAITCAGVTTHTRDPYSFGLILDTDDLLAVRGEGPRQAYESLGAHRRTLDGVDGMTFAVWAPNATRVSVVGAFNDWDSRTHSMRFRHVFGVWELFVPGLEAGILYKYEILGPDGVCLPLKADPYAFAAELPPATASITQPLPQKRMADGAKSAPAREQPVSIYECHWSAP